MKENKNSKGEVKAKELTPKGKAVSPGSIVKYKNKDSLLNITTTKRINPGK